MSQKFHLIVLGKLKDSHLLAIEEEYKKRLKNIDFKIHELKSSAEDKQKESKKALDFILEKSSSRFIVLLDEKGMTFTSKKFSSWLFEEQSHQKEIFFVIGGAEGHSEELKNKADACLCLSALTFPHKLARIIFVEQLYRAMTIHIGHPYHN